ncbi:MAG: MFS transporter [Candidatus Helarchaeota archaeon]
MVENVEIQEWTSYYTYVIAFMSVLNFFTLFNIVYGGFILNNVANSFGISVTILPVFTSIMALGIFPVIFVQNLADIFGRKKVLFVISNLTYFLGYFYILSPNIIIFTIFGFVSSCFGINLINVIISEEIPAKSRGTAIGVVQGIGMSASLLAAFMSMFLGLSPDMWRYIFLAVNIPGQIIFSIMCLFMRETKRFMDHKLKEQTFEVQQEKFKIFSVFQRKYLKIFTLSASLMFIVQCIYLTVKRYYKPFLLNERTFLGFNDAVVGYWMIFIYLGSIFSYYLSGWLSDQIGRKKTIYISASVYFISNIFFVILQNKFGIFISLLGINMSFAIFIVVVQIFAVEFFSTKERATGLGWVTLIGNTPWIFANLLIFYLVNTFSWGATFLILGFLPIVLIMITFFMPETKKLVLEDIHDKFIEKEKLL